MGSLPFNGPTKGFLLGNKLAVTEFLSETRAIHTQIQEVFGARLTGGGFGGSVVMLARLGAGRAVAERIAGTYARESGQNHPSS